MKLLSPIFNLLSIAAIIIFIPSLFFGKKNFDVHIHDTYYVIGIGQFLKMLAFVLLALWMIYKLSENILYSTKLTQAHVIATVITMLLIATVFYWGSIRIWTPGEKYVESVTPGVVMKSLYTARIVMAVVLAFVLAQFILIVNIISGIIKR